MQVAYQNWVNDTCWPFPDQGATCSGAGLPVYSVNASSAEHVVAAVDFARENAVRLVVKGTGHDFRGRSTAPESLSIWTHFITGTTWHDDFEIGGESLGPAVTVPAGENHLSAFETAKEHGYMVVAGGGPTVGEGGFALGGGHGLITVKHGLAVDNILQARIVTPDGKLVTINEQENTDLFWAVRGGGGSTFGVMIDLTIRAFPMESFTEYSIVISAPFNYTKMYDVLAYMAYQFPRIAELNVMSYTSIAPPVNDTQQWAITSLLGGLNYTAEEASGILDPLTNGLNATFGSEVLIDKNVTFYDTIWDWWSTHLDLTTTPIGVDIIIGSRILDAKALQNSSFAKAFETASAGSGSQLYLVSGPGSRQHTADYNSLLPAWRTGYVHALLASGWPPGNETAKAEQIDLVTNNRTGALRELAPDTGSYMNEVRSLIFSLTLLTISRVIRLSQTSKKHSGGAITIDF